MGPLGGLGLALLFVALLIYGLAAKGTSDEIDSALAEGRAPRAPEFTLEVLERGTLPAAWIDRSVGARSSDGKVSVSELRGTPLVLNLWASWCTPCEEESPPPAGGMGALRPPRRRVPRTQHPGPAR